jgi:hypothetical protein
METLNPMKIHLSGKRVNQALADMPVLLMHSVSTAALRAATNRDENISCDD